MTASSANPAHGCELSVSFAGIQLKNPVIAASGTFAYGIEFAKLLDLNALGGLVVKVGSRMIDTSIRSKLANLQNAMKEVG